jgi:hypothetical protein
VPDGVFVDDEGRLTFMVHPVLLTDDVCFNRTEPR